jgi:GTP cyclohydrolase II
MSVFVARDVGGVIDGRRARVRVMTMTRVMTTTRRMTTRETRVVRASGGGDANGDVNANVNARDGGDVRGVRDGGACEADDSRDAREADARAEATTTFVAETKLPTDRGFYRVRAYRHVNPNTGEVTEPVCVIYGEVEGREDVPVRVHDACFTSEVLGSMKCDCKQQLEMAMDYIKESGPGMVCYLQQEGRGIGLANKIAAYAVQEEGVDTVDANRRLGLPDDTREYTAVENMLRELDVKSVQLMTNNPRKIRELECGGIKITGRIACVVKANLFNEGYLAAKERRMSHVLDQSWRYWDANGATYDSVDELDASMDDDSTETCEPFLSLNPKKFKD